MRTSTVKSSRTREMAKEGACAGVAVLVGAAVVYLVVQLFQPTLQLWLGSYTQLFIGR